MNSEKWSPKNANGNDALPTFVEFYEATQSDEPPTGKVMEMMMMAMARVIAGQVSQSLTKMVKEGETTEEEVLASLREIALAPEEQRTEMVGRLANKHSTVASLISDLAKGAPDDLSELLGE